MRRRLAVTAIAVLLTLFMSDSPWSASFLFEGRPSWRLEELQPIGGVILGDARETRSSCGEYIVCSDTGAAAGMVHTVLIIREQ